MFLVDVNICIYLLTSFTFYNQHQRKWKKNEKGEYYIETTLEDIEWANWLVKDSLLRKSDELNSQLRHFFEGIKRVINKEESFYAKQIREQFRMNPMRVNRYLSELEMRGYIKRTGGNRKTGFEYEITSWEEYELLKSGIDILDKVLEKIRAKYNGKSTHKTTVKLSIT